MDSCVSASCYINPEQEPGKRLFGLKPLKWSHHCIYYICLMSDVIYQSQMSDDRCLISDNIYYMSYVKCQIRYHMSDFRCHMPNFWCQMSDVRRMSDAKCYMPNVTCQMSYIYHILDYKCHMSDARFEISDIRYQISDVRWHMSDVRCQILDVIGHT